MTVKQLNEILKEHNVPEDAQLMSDSGWECDPTEMDAVWYEPMHNTVIFTQGGKYEVDSYSFNDLACLRLYCEGQP